jgi:acyl-CoA reductase-like NAD-dependent aldehyde dehydrogenase
MADLSAEQLQKAANIIARGSFSNCGHNFNSIKRIFIDREIGEAFMERLVTEAQLYTVAEGYSDLNKGLLAPFVNEEELKEGIEQLKALKEKYGD